jgi:nucleoside-diphosphate-sugar epimerase
MRVTITGASGFLGNNLAAALLEQGHEVVAADRARAAGLDDLDVEFVEIDVLTRDPCARLSTGRRWCSTWPPSSRSAVTPTASSSG